MNISLLLGFKPNKKLDNKNIIDQMIIDINTNKPNLICIIVKISIIIIKYIILYKIKIIY